MTLAPRIWVGPEPRPDLEAAILAAGAGLTPLPEAEAVIWTADQPDLLRSLLHPRIRWVQLLASGADLWIDAGAVDSKRVWTAAKGVAARSIAEHVACLMLAAARDLPRRIRATRWGETGGRALEGGVVGIVGAGEVGRALIDLLVPFRMETIALTRTGHDVPGATHSVGANDFDRLLEESNWVVVCAPATPETHGLLGERKLGLMRSDSWLINVSRGTLVDTDALVAALAEGRPAGAALDVTDPEPLPDGHPLWGLPNVIITPHVATTPAIHGARLCDRVYENAARFRFGRDLLGVVDLQSGY